MGSNGSATKFAAPQVLEVHNVFRDLQRTALEDGIYKHLVRGILEVNGALLMLRRPKSKAPTDTKGNRLEYPGGKADRNDQITPELHLSDLIFDGSTAEYRAAMLPGVDVIALILDRHIEPIEVALPREFLEETGNALVRIGELVYVQDFKDKEEVRSREFSFKVEVGHPMKRIVHPEHAGYLWVPRFAERAVPATEAYWAQNSVTPIA